MNLGPGAPLRGIAQTSGLTLSLSCKWAQDALASRAAVRAQCLAQGRHLAGVHTLFPFLVGGAHPYSTPYPEPHALPSAPLICCPKAILPPTELLWLIPDPRSWSGGEKVPKGSESKFPRWQVLMVGGGWRCRRRAVSHQLGAAECSEWSLGGYSQRIQVPGVCVSPSSHHTLAGHRELAAEHPEPSAGWKEQ